MTPNQMIAAAKSLEKSLADDQAEPYGRSNESVIEVILTALAAAFRDAAKANDR